MKYLKLFEDVENEEDYFMGVLKSIEEEHSCELIGITNTMGTDNVGTDFLLDDPSDPIQNVTELTIGKDGKEYKVQSSYLFLAKATDSLSMSELADAIKSVVDKLFLSPEKYLVGIDEG